MDCKKFVPTLIVYLLIFTSPMQAQVTPLPTEDLLLFVWNDTLFAQAFDDSQIINVQEPFLRTQPLPPTQYGSVVDFPHTLHLDMLDGYGFYQGVWSPNETRFDLLAIKQAEYRVITIENGLQRTLISGNLAAEQGYLVPVGWDRNDNLILLERHMLHNLEQVRLWQYSESDSSLRLRQVVETAELRGNSVSLADDWLFVGFDIARSSGQIINLHTGQMLSFSTGFTLPNPPKSVFETYPIEVLGVVNTSALQTWRADFSATTEAHLDEPVSTTPFLYWPLPDDARSVTCYPDSDYTDARFAVECPGLAVPREYLGHEGTDIGGSPNGLPVSTPVYAAAPGLVIKVNRECAAEDVACGDAYGNYVLLEHARVNDDNIEVWFTGYAHLQTVLTDRFAYVSVIGIPIALSGDTGLGGAHLHFEIRAPHLATVTNWLDPWDTRLSDSGTGLWHGTVDQPEAAVAAMPPSTQQFCYTVEGNNLRSGPGTHYHVVTRSVAEITYEVFQVITVDTGDTTGDWYHVRWDGSETTGWIWASLMTTCTPNSNG